MKTIVPALMVLSSLFLYSCKEPIIESKDPIIKPTKEAVIKENRESEIESTNDTRITETNVKLFDIYDVDPNIKFSNQDILPNTALVDEIRALPEKETRVVETLKLSAKNIPSDSIYAEAAQGSNLSMPVQVKDEIVLLLDPRLDQSEIKVLLTEYSLGVTHTIPQIAALVVTDLKPETDRNKTKFPSTKALASSETNSLINVLQDDIRIVSATPNSILSSFSIQSAVTPSTPPLSATLKSEFVDWGMRDTEIDKSWSIPIPHIDVGVLDVGFSPHPDLPLKRALNQAVKTDDHGTHVAGIMCAKHNGEASKGAIKDCTVHYATASSVLAKISPVEWTEDNISQYIARSSVFSEYVGTVLDFMEENPDVKIINLSVGYNWMPNFGADPRNDANLRNLVRGNARLFMSMLAYAAERDVILVSAAGNDSKSLSEPLEARWASPFNAGAKMMELKFGWSNGVIVEAHNASNKRASFSNVGGHISCPGVAIVSTTFSPPTNMGTMSGTSMAAPYCASGLAILRNTYPDYPLRRIIRCAVDNPEKIENRIPKFNLSKAIKRCENLDQYASLKQNFNQIESWSSVDTSTKEGQFLTDTSIENSCSEYAAVIPITLAADFGDGNGVELANDETKKEVYSFLDQILQDECDEQINLLTSLSFYSSQNIQQYVFVAALWEEINRAGIENTVSIQNFPVRPDDQQEQMASFLAENVIISVGHSDAKGLIKIKSEAPIPP